MGQAAGQLAVGLGLGEELVGLLLEGGDGVGAGGEAHGGSARARTQPFFRYYDKAANDTVALLRAEAGRDPYDRDLSDLIGQLSTRSQEFRRRWAADDVRIHTSGVKLLHHPVVGDLDLPYWVCPI